MDAFEETLDRLPAPEVELGARSREDVAIAGPLEAPYDGALRGLWWPATQRRRSNIY
jgi:hypothetical protein